MQINSAFSGKSFASSNNYFWRLKSENRIANGLIWIRYRVGRKLHAYSSYQILEWVGGGLCLHQKTSTKGKYLLHVWTRKEVKNEKRKSRQSTRRKSIKYFRILRGKRCCSSLLFVFMERDLDKQNKKASLKRKAKAINFKKKEKQHRNRSDCLHKSYRGAEKFLFAEDGEARDENKQQFRVKFHSSWRFEGDLAAFDIVVVEQTWCVRCWRQDFGWTKTRNFWYCRRQLNRKSFRRT